MNVTLYGCQYLEHKWLRNGGIYSFFKIVGTTYYDTDKERSHIPGKEQEFLLVHSK
jgi:hypothetical protein